MFDRMVCNSNSSCCGRFSHQKPQQKVAQGHPQHKPQPGFFVAISLEPCMFAPCGVASPPVILACPWRGGEQPMDHRLQRSLLVEHFFCGRLPPACLECDGLSCNCAGQELVCRLRHGGPLLNSVSESRGQVAAGDYIGR